MTKPTKRLTAEREQVARKWVAEGLLGGFLIAEVLVELDAVRVEREKYKKLLLKYGYNEDIEETPNAQR